MSNLIKRFKEDLQLAGYAKRSIQSYTSAVLKLQRFYNKPLEDITEEHLRQYWLCCQNEFGWSAATLRISYSGIQHFFTRTLVQSWNIFNDINWRREQTLPTILSLEEVRKIIYALPTCAKSCILFDIIFHGAAGSKYPHMACSKNIRP
ncbi:MAG: hypothetical protein A2097_04780 [Desulfobacula sp. GWF2_41_7]|nr:MAG: hypothetical protein A2097_04780 [Desulfobacula sp. GWF2_41_7]